MIVFVCGSADIPRLGESLSAGAFSTQCQGLGYGALVQVELPVATYVFLYLSTAGAVQRALASHIQKEMVRQGCVVLNRAEDVLERRMSSCPARTLADLESVEIPTVLRTVPPTESAQSPPLRSKEELEEVLAEWLLFGYEPRHVRLSQPLADLTQGFQLGSLRLGTALPHAIEGSSSRFVRVLSSTGGEWFADDGAEAALALLRTQGADDALEAIDVPESAARFKLETRGVAEALLRAFS
jgi:hypothetical protein